MHVIICFSFTCLSNSFLELHWKVQLSGPLESKAQCFCVLFSSFVPIFSHLPSSTRNISSPFSCPVLLSPFSGAPGVSPEGMARLAGGPAWSCPPTGGTSSSFDVVPMAQFNSVIVASLTSSASVACSRSALKPPMMVACLFVGKLYIGELK